jgi:threonine dehydrogenase-like Zn-dependent dehydrogenase
MKRISAKVVSPKKIELIEEDIPSLAADDVLIKVAACGICQTEIPAYDGSVQGKPGVSFRYRSFPSDLGHEVSGIIADIGSNVTNVKIGQRVTGIIYSGCGFSTYITEKSKWILPISDKLSLEHALGEPIMCITNILRLSRIDFNDSVYIIGSGFMSLLTIAALSHFPIKSLIVSGHYDNRLKMAKNFGATLTINAGKQDIWKIIMDHTDGKGVDVSIDLTGKMDMLKTGASVVKAKQRSRLVMAGVYGEESFTIGNYLQNRAPMLVAAYPNQSPDMMDDLRRGMLALEQSWLPMKELITHRFSLDEAAKGMEMARSKSDGYIKGIIVPDKTLI